MKPLTAGVTKANEGIDAISWNILGQTYVPKMLSEDSFSWHATFPPGTFVPPHIHPTQDEFIYMLEGVMDYSHSRTVYRLHAGDSLQLDGEGAHGPVDLVEVPIRFLSVIAFPDSQV